MKETRADTGRALGYALLLHTLPLALFGFWWSRDAAPGSAGSAIETDLADPHALSAAMVRAMRAPTQPLHPLDSQAPQAQSVSASFPRETGTQVAQAEPEATREIEQQRVIMEDFETRSEEQAEEARERLNLDREQQQTLEVERPQSEPPPVSEQAPSEAVLAQPEPHPEQVSSADLALGSEGTASDLLARYQAALRGAIQRSWRRPGWLPPGQRCKLVITQKSGGEVTEVQADPSCPYNALARRSIEAAVLMVQPLPYAGFESVFEQVMTLEVEAPQEKPAE